MQNTPKSLMFVATGVVLFGVVGGIVAANLFPADNSPVTYGPEDYRGQGMRHSWVGFSDEMLLEEMVELIARGQVVDIQPSRWNSPDGLEWEPDVWDNDWDSTQVTPLLTHTIIFEIEEPYFDLVGVEGTTISMIMLGTSPSDDLTDAQLETIEFSHNLRVGDELVLMASYGELFISDGTKVPAFGAIGYPSGSYFVLGDDGYYHIDRPGLEEPMTLQEIQTWMQQHIDLQ